MKRLVLGILPIVDLLMVLFVYPAALLLKCVRMAGVNRLPQSKRALLQVGVFPVRNHYYEPQFDYRSLRMDLDKERHLPGIDWNEAGQLGLLERLSYAGELGDIQDAPGAASAFRFGNGKFESGDAEYWYQIIRAVRPRRIVEIGSGNSTLVALKALARNRAEDPAYTCEHTCIEPYEMPWLEATGVSVVRSRVEDLQPDFFDRLQENDILFIDSSHVIRPQGDVLFEFLEVLPVLNKGVIVHVHDVFSPRNYLGKWLVDEVSFWNEQYLLEAFLTHNPQWKIIGALNFLRHRHFEKLKGVAPYLTSDREPGSFYMQRVS